MNVCCSTLEKLTRILTPCPHSPNPLLALHPPNGIYIDKCIMLFQIVSAVVHSCRLRKTGTAYFHGLLSRDVTCDYHTSRSLRSSWRKDELLGTSIAFIHIWSVTLTPEMIMGWLTSFTRISSWTIWVICRITPVLPTFIIKLRRCNIIGLPVEIKEYSFDPPSCVIVYMVSEVLIEFLALQIDKWHI